MLGPNKKKKKQKKDTNEKCAGSVSYHREHSETQSKIPWYEMIIFEHKRIPRRKKESVASSYVRKMHIESDPQTHTHTQVHKKRKIKRFLKKLSDFQ